MATYKLENFKIGAIPYEDGDVFDNCNLMRKAAGTDPFPDRSRKVTVRGGNAVNCVFGNNVTIEGNPNRTQKSFCAHLHPAWGLQAEADNCAHVVETHEIIIDGEQVDLEYEREDTVV